MSLGVLLGLIQLPIPGIGSVSMAPCDAIRGPDGHRRSAVCGLRRHRNAATLVYANKVVTSDRIAAASATTFSSMTILKILCAQVALALL